MKTPKEMALKTFTIDDIRSWKCYYNPSRHLPENWIGTAIDILKHESIPSRDKFWVVCREEVLDAKTLRLFAVWCARQVEHLMTDERSKNAIDVAERFANGNATQVELTAAWEAAKAAAGEAVRVAARAGAWQAAEAAVYTAGCAAGWAAGWEAGWVAARAAGCAAGWAANWAAGWEAAGAAGWEAAEVAQVAQLLKMLEEA